jgi:flavin reductase (DIM6/NTAB) family NADH-FMN oxidoreductase RutF
MVSPDDTYQLLRQLTTPVVAITSHHEGKRNGMIIDSAIRASIVPTIPRVAIFVHKFNLSHDLIFHSGAFVLHLLRFFHGTDRDKLAQIPHRLGRLGAPVLDECHAHFECRVVNAMDTGSSTCFLADVVVVGYGAADAPQGAVMTAPYFRSHLPTSWGTSYQDQLAAAQAFARERSGDIRPLVWRDLGG